MDPVQPEDIAILIAFAAHDDTCEQISGLLWGFVPPERLQASLARLQKARLYSPYGQRVARPLLARLFIHGVPFLFPATIGPLAIGMRAAWSHPRISSEMGLIVPTHQTIVWPLAGPVSDTTNITMGQALEPLAPWVGDLARSDHDFYWHMSLVECLRAGRARERAWASQQLGFLWGNAA